MNRRTGAWMIALMVLITACGTVWAQEEGAEPEALIFEQPVLITSIGQSAGAAQARVLAIKAGLDATYNQRASVEELESFAALVVVLGASSKGLGAAGVDIDGEIAWGTELINKAIELGIPIIAMHIEGDSRRGASSDLIVTTFASQANYLIVKGSMPDTEWTEDEAADGNKDGLFTTLAADGEIPIAYITKTLDAVDVLVEIFGITTDEE